MPPTRANPRARNPDLNDSVTLEMDTAEGAAPINGTLRKGLPGSTNTVESSTPINDTLRKGPPGSTKTGESSAPINDTLRKGPPGSTITPESSAPSNDTPRKGPPGHTNTRDNSTEEGNIRHNQSVQSNIRHNSIEQLNISLEQGNSRDHGEHGNPRDKIEQANIRMFNYLHINPDEYNISGDQLKNVVDKCFSYAIISGAFKEIHNQLKNIAEAIPFLWPAPPQSFRSLEDLKTWAKEQSRIWEKYNISAVLQRQQSRSTELIKESTTGPRDNSPAQPGEGEHNDRPDPSNSTTRNKPEEQSRHRERVHTRPPTANRSKDRQPIQSNRPKNIETRKDKNPINKALVEIRNRFSEADLIKNCQPDQDGEPSDFKTFAGYRSLISKWAKSCLTLEKDPDNRLARKHYSRHAKNIEDIIKDTEDSEELQRLIGKAYRAVSKSPELHSFFHPKPIPQLTSLQLPPQQHTQIPQSSFNPNPPMPQNPYNSNPTTHNTTYTNSTHTNPPHIWQGPQEYTDPKNSGNALSEDKRVLLNLINNLITKM